MKCPHCGRDLSENDRFCPTCGAPVTPPENGEKAGENKTAPDPFSGYAAPSVPPVRDGGSSPRRAAVVVKAVLAVILYIALFFGIQSCVIGTYIGSNLDMTGAVLAAEEGDQAAFESIWRQTMQSALDLLYERQTLLLLISNLAAVLVLCLQFRLRRRKPAEEFALHPASPFRLIQFAVFGVALNAAISILLGLLPLPEDLFTIQEEQYAALYEGSLLLNLFSVGIVGPVTEELFFRGIPMTRLEPVMGGIGAAVVSSFLFGLAHGTPIAVGYAFIVGMVLALIYRKYRTILPGIVCHCFFNMTSYWLRDSWEGPAVVVLGVVSFLIVIATWHTAVIRYPSFGDVVWDTAGVLRSDDPARAAVIADYRAARKSGTLDAETLERLSAEWDKASGSTPPGQDGGEK